MIRIAWSSSTKQPPRPRWPAATVALLVARAAGSPCLTDMTRTTTITAALRATSLIAKTVLDGATNGVRAQTYVTLTLTPILRPGDTVILDNLHAHKVAGGREAIEAVGVWVLYLPPYSPDFNPCMDGSCRSRMLDWSG